LISEIICQKYKMVHTNYKWNLSKKKGEQMIQNEITAILNEKLNHLSDIDEVLLILTNRTKDIVIKNKNKRKNINNYINNVFGGLINYLEQSDHFQLMNQKDKLLLTFKNDRPDFKEWIIVDDY